MSTQAQISANRQNAQHSTGPKSEAGRATSCRNNFRHGFTGAFILLAGEDREEFDELVNDLLEEHQPQDATEEILVKKMAQHHWLVQRAVMMQAAMDQRLAAGRGSEAAQLKLIALYLRYQTANDRAFHKCLDQLLKLKAERRKVEIGFESQQHKRNEEMRRQDLHNLKHLLLEEKLATQIKKNLKLDQAAKPAPATQNPVSEAKIAA